MPKQSILYIDLLKLFTIYLVLWGHAIMHFQPDFHDSYIFRTIYAFHMPLFMMLSGYFAVSSMELSPKDFFPKKFRQLLLPCISWAIVCWLVITSGLLLTFALCYLIYETICNSKMMGCLMFGLEYKKQ